MNGQPAVIVTAENLEQLMLDAGRTAAREVLERVTSDANLDPLERHVRLLRDYLEDRSVVSKPRELFASSRHIRLLAPNRNGKPKSVSWFQTFKQESGLARCDHRPSPTHGRLHEWCFEDIANAWVHYHRQRWLREA